MAGQYFRSLSSREYSSLEEAKKGLSLVKNIIQKNEYSKMSSWNIERIIPHLLSLLQLSPDEQQKHSSDLILREGSPMNWGIRASPLALAELSPRVQKKISAFLAKETSQLMREVTAFLQEKAAFLERKENWGTLFKSGGISPEIALSKVRLPLSSISFMAYKSIWKIVLGSSSTNPVYF
jgi:DNA-directed RNA polymerase subunit F